MAELDITSTISGATGNLILRDPSRITALLERSSDGTFKVWFRNSVNDDLRGPITLALTPPLGPGPLKEMPKGLPSIEDIQELYFVLHLNEESKASLILSLYDPMDFTYLEGLIWSDTADDDKRLVDLDWLKPRDENEYTVRRYAMIRTNSHRRLMHQPKKIRA